MYRVAFWSQPRPNWAWNVDIWRLSDCVDVHEVISWAERQSHGRQSQLFVLGGPEDDRADPWILLAGEDPNAILGHHQSTVHEDEPGREFSPTIG